MRIGVFDSGLGGLTVVQGLFRSVAVEDMIYLGDTARLPYGTKSADTIRQFAREDASFLMSQHVDLIVVACHTASAHAYEDLKTYCSVPVLDVIVPTCEQAARVTKTGVIGMIGTLATASSGVYEKRLKTLNPTITVKTRACSLLVSLAEEGWIETDIAYAVVREYMENFLTEDMDTLILGCTHFPVFKKVIQDVVGRRIRLVDPVEELQNKIRYILKLNDANHAGASHLKIYVSDFVQRFKDVMQIFLKDVGQHVDSVQLVSNLVDYAKKEQEHVLL